MNIEDKLNAVNARLAERMAAIERRVSDRFGTGTSAPGSAVTRAPAAAPAAHCAYYGVFVGVNHSPGNPVLEGCFNDANDLRAACVELGDWQQGNTVVMEDATCSQFEDCLGKIARAAKSGDVVLVLFSGHGGAFGSNPDDDFVFCMGDGPFPEKRFRKALSAFQPGVRVVVVVDACQSDAAATGTSVGQSLLPNVGWITASTSWQNSDDGFQGSRRNGFLTGALLEGWRKGGAAGMSAQAKAAASADVRQQSVVSPDLVNFLDLAVFVAHSWRYWHPTFQQPQYHNPAILEAVPAGRIGATAVDPVNLPDGGKRGGSPKRVHHYYCDKCGHKWHSDGWDSYCPKFGCTGHAKEM